MTLDFLSLLRVFVISVTTSSSPLIPWRLLLIELFMFTELLKRCWAKKLDGRQYFSFLRNVILFFVVVTLLPMINTEKKIKQVVVISKSVSQSSSQKKHAYEAVSSINIYKSVSSFFYWRFTRIFASLPLSEEGNSKIGHQVI